MESVHVPSLASAVKLAERLRAQGVSDCFRGQLHSWPLKSSLARLNKAKEAKAAARLKAFVRWATACPGLECLRTEPRQAVAVAQHYGIPTAYVDFSTNVSAAAFFASHGRPDPGAFGPNGCIYHFNASEMREAMLSFAQTQDDPAALVQVHVPDLWRMQAQHGLFLHLPWRDGLMDADLLDLILPIRKITFPVCTKPSGKEDVFYPIRRSTLEILIDEYFAQENLMTKVASVDEDALLFRRSWSWQYEPKHFVNGDLPPVLLSWTKATEWLASPDENWHDLGHHLGPELSVDATSDFRLNQNTVAQTVLDWLEISEDARRQMIDWRISHSRPLANYIAARRSKNVHAPSCLEEVVVRVWDGMRTMPYSGSAIADAIGTSVALYVAGFQGIQSPFDMLLGASRTIEFGATEATYSRAQVVEDSLLACVRSDLPDFLLFENNEADGSATSLMSRIVAVRSVYEFDKLAAVFAAQLIPSQIFDPYTKHTFFNPARLSFLGSSTQHLAWSTHFFNQSAPPNVGVLYLPLDLTDNDLLFLMLWTKVNTLDRAQEAPTIIISGFEADSRELWEIPEVQLFCDRLVRLGFISILRVTTLFDRSFTLPTWGAFEIFLVHLRAMRETMAASELTEEFGLFKWVLGGSANHLLLQLHIEWTAGKRLYVPALRADFVAKRGGKSRRAKPRDVT